MFEYMYFSSKKKYRGGVSLKELEKTVSQKKQYL